MDLYTFVIFIPQFNISLVSHNCAYISPTNKNKSDAKLFNSKVTNFVKKF